MACSSSIFKTSLRALFGTFFAVVGLGAALFFLVWFVGWLSASDPSHGLKEDYALEVLPDANHKRQLLDLNTPVILQIDIHGVIGMDGLMANHIRQQLQESQEGVLAGGRVKALLLHINSPGGVVFDADDIHEAILAYKQRNHVPVYAFVDGLCASGGFYIACAADKIYANPTSIIGSVGVISNYFNVSDLLHKVGVQALTLTAGNEKDDMNPFRPWTPDEAKHRQELTDYFYKRFVATVTKERPQLTAQKLVDVYGAQIFVAPQALENGYLDGVVANREEVLEKLLAAIPLPAKSAYQVSRFKKSQPLLELFEGNCSVLRQGTLRHEITLPGTFNLKLANQPLYLYQPTS